MCWDLRGIWRGRALKELPDQGGEIEAQLSIMRHVSVYGVLEQGNKSPRDCLPWFKFPKARQHRPLHGDLPAAWLLLTSSLIPFWYKSRPLPTTPGWGVFPIFVCTDPSLGSQRSLCLRRTQGNVARSPSGIRIQLQTLPFLGMKIGQKPRTSLNSSHALPPSTPP